MNEWINNLLSQFRALSFGRQVAFVVTGLGSLAFFVWLGNGAGHSEYRLLFGGLDEDQALAVVEGLEAEKIPYRLDRGGSAVFVPATLVYEARIRVAGRGLPGGGAGFEIFDQTRFGVTDFVQRVNFLRALQGELARSIEQLDPVERARVQIALPEKSPFVKRDEETASASVVLRLHPGRDLGEEQVRGMVHLVAASVPALRDDRVTIVDSGGRMLAPSDDRNAGPRAPAGAQAQQQRLEGELAGRIESILEPTVGMGRVVARVRAHLDWTQSEHTEERFDPDSQVARSEQRSTETTSDGVAVTAEGVPGVRSNEPGAPAAPEGEPGRMASRNSETVNYEISKTVSRRVDPVGTIQRLDVAVLVDGKPAAPGAEGSAGEAAFTPWSAEEVTQFEALAMRAVGFDPERGDQITVTSAPFRSLELGPVESGFALDPQLLGLLGTVLHYGGLALAIFLFARFVGRPLATALAAPEPALQGSHLPATAADLEARMAAAQGVALSGPMLQGLAPPGPPPTLAEQVGAITEKRGDNSVKTLRGWLDQ